MTKKKILYLFRRPVGINLNKARRGNYPHDFFYGLTKVEKKLQVSFNDKIFYNKLITFTDHLIIKIFYGKFKTGVSFASVLLQRAKINGSDLVFATVDSIGLPYAFYKYLNVFRTPFIFNTIGLCDSLNESQSEIYKYLVKKTTVTAAKIVSGASFAECKKLSKQLNMPLSKFEFVPFGIDTKYFYPRPDLIAEDFILAIGADPKRDWELYKKVIKNFPKIKFVIITDKRIYQSKPQNVDLYYNLEIEKVRDFIWKSRLALILSKQNYHFAGQSTILRCMSCAKPVIFTKSYGTEEYGFQNGFNALMVEPTSAKEVIKAIKKYFFREKELKVIGINARTLVIKKYDINLYSSRLTKIFSTQLSV